MCKIDLKDAYFSIPVHKDSRKAVRFLWAGNLHEFLYLCFGLGAALRIFTKLLKIPISVLRRLMIRVIIYLDDLFILGKVWTKYLWQGTLWSSYCNSRLCDKSEEVCVRSCTRNGVLRVDWEFPNYDFVITREKDSEDKGSVPEFVQNSRGITSQFDKTNRKTFFNHSSSAPSPSTVSLLTTTANLSLKQTQSYLTLVKLTPMAKNELQ